LFRVAVEHQSLPQAVNKTQRTVGEKKEEVTMEWKSLHKEQLQNMCLLSYCLSYHSRMIEIYERIEDVARMMT
jgi:hypothetical protein